MVCDNAIFQKFWLPITWILTFYSLYRKWVYLELKIWHNYKMFLNFYISVGALIWIISVESWYFNQKHLKNSWIV